MNDLFAQLNPQPEIPVMTRSAPTAAGHGMVKSYLERHGFVADRWGNYHNPDRPNRRYKLTQRVLRYEARLATGEWFRLRSGFYRHLYVNGADHLCGLRA